MMKKKTIVAWSGGKDCAYGLKKLRENPEIEVVKLFTTVSADHYRISIHGVRESLLDRQAEQLDLPVDKVYIPEECSRERYEEIMMSKLKEFEQEADLIAYSDLYLEDVREGREEKLSDLDLEGYWPVWGIDTGELSRKIIDAGFRTVTVCVDGEKLDRKFVGREYTEEFLQELPEDTDPCGEDGEFHTFVYEAPIFNEGIDMDTGRKIERESNGQKFFYCDLVT